MHTVFIGVFFLLFSISNKALGETLLEKSSRFGADFTSTELVSIFMAEVAYCEANTPGFKEQAAAPLKKIQATKKFQEIKNSPNFIKLSIEASELVAKQRANSGAASCPRTLEQIHYEVKGFQQ